MKVELHAHSTSDDTQISVENVELSTTKQIRMVIYKVKVTT